MAQNVALTPIDKFFALSGSPLNNGKLYFGLVDQDPEQFPVQMYWDEAGTIPALQPIRTISGYPVRAGTPAVIYGPASYSIRVKESNDVQVFYIADVSSSFNADAINFLQSGVGAVSRTVQNKLRESISVKDFGAVGDGVTDDTAAINLAIDEANVFSNGQYRTLFFDSGTYLVTPGGLHDILCDVDGPRAILKARTDTEANLLTIGHTDALTNGQIIRLFGLTGFGFNFGATDARHGIGIGFNVPATKFLGQLKVEVFYIQGFTKGINADCSNGSHIGTNVFTINTLWYCTYGVWSNSGNLEFENNKFEITYMAVCNFNIYSTASGTAHNVQNLYHIHALELHVVALTNGFNLVGVNNNQNIYIVDAIFYNANTEWIVVSDGLSTRNEFRLPQADFSKIAALGNVFKLDGIGKLNDPNPTRSIVYGPSPAPTTGTWNIGDRYIVNNPTGGGVASFCYIAAGWVPETTAAGDTYTPAIVLGANAAASTAYLAKWTRNGNIVSVFGALDITASVANTLTKVTIALPVASAFTNGFDAAGTAGGVIANSIIPGFINANTGADTAELNVSPTTTANTNYSYHFSYLILGI